MVRAEYEEYAFSPYSQEYGTEYGTEYGENTVRNTKNTGIKCVEYVNYVEYGMYSSTRVYI